MDKIVWPVGTTAGEKGWLGRELEGEYIYMFLFFKQKLELAQALQ